MPMPRPRARRSRPYPLVLALLALAATAPLAAREGVPTAAEWREDLAHLAETLAAVHPNLYARVSRERFAAAVDELDARIPALSRAEIVTGMMRVSTIYHQLSSYAGDERLQPIALPAPFDAAAWFGGSDPAIGEILRTRERPLIAEIIRSEGAAAGIAEYEKRRADYRGVAWWAPFTLGELDRLGNELRDAGRLEDALAVYRLNARRHPDHWRVWDSLGEAYTVAGNTSEAIRHYERALAVDPYNNLAPYQREALEALRAAP